MDAILLAGGQSRRMGFPKPLLRVGDRTFIATIAATILSVVPRLLILLGANAEQIRAAIPADDRIKVVVNPDYQRGQLSSLKVALREVAPEAAGVLVHLCDHPLVRAQTFRAAIELYERSRKPIVVARHGGRRGHPVIFDRALFAELAAAPEEQGARQVVNADPARVVYADVDDAGVSIDLDTPDDLARAGLPPIPSNR